LGELWLLCWVVAVAAVVQSIFILVLVLLIKAVLRHVRSVALQWTVRHSSMVLAAAIKPVRWRQGVSGSGSALDAMRSVPSVVITMVIPAVPCQRSIQVVVGTRVQTIATVHVV
jgi:hypothetical protein